MRNPKSNTYADPFEKPTGARPRRAVIHVSSRVLAYSWASPTTAVGLVAGLLTLASGGRARRRSGTIEFHGGFARWMLMKTPIRASAMTLGHVILGRDPKCLDVCRAHELVHVRQAERWGVLFLPAYALASAWVWVRGGKAYRDNPFERAARRACGEREDRCG